jgi:hypothetical protein
LEEVLALAKELQEIATGIGKKLWPEQVVTLAFLLKS